MTKDAVTTERRHRVRVLPEDPRIRQQAGQTVHEQASIFGH